MGLVAYSESEDEEDDTTSEPLAKKTKVSHAQDAVTDKHGGNKLPPPLPSAFKDLYSSTVRISSSDDPSLHGGRKRVVPHVEGNWAAHVYLEWHPSSAEHNTLSKLVSSIQAQTLNNDTSTVHSLLTDSLSVPQPLHISLSAPLVLRSETKDAFLHSILDAIQSTTRRCQSLTVSPTTISWHSNEERTRCFLVLNLSRPEEDVEALNRLLNASNATAESFGCPKLYAGQRGSRKAAAGGSVASPASQDHSLDASDAFHVSIAWSLDPDLVLETGVLQEDERLKALMDEVRTLRISFSEVKVRMGKDVSNVSFGRMRQGGTRGLF